MSLPGYGDHKDRFNSGSTYQGSMFSSKYHGLVNQGSTCYLNSVLQVLFMTKDFREAVERSSCDTTSLDFHLQELFNELKSSTAYTYKLTRVLGISRGFMQSDAAECFENILSKVTSSGASQLFQGKLTIKNKCSTCNEETSTEDPFWSLPLELEDCYDNYFVTNGIDNYFKESHLREPNQLYCEQCSTKTDATIKVEMKHHPEVLTLLLKRFKFHYDSLKHVKVTRSVKIPEFLQIPPDGDQSQKYQLYAYVEHSGELTSGHYIVTIKSEDDDRWYIFNDSLVYSTCVQPFERNSYEINPGAYLLFYRKKEVESATDPLNADNGGLSTSDCFMSDQPCREKGEPREGQEGDVTAARTENSEVAKKSHQNKREMNHSKMTETVDKVCMSMCDKPPVSREPMKINNDNKMDMGNKQVVGDEGQSTGVVDNQHNEQHQDLYRKQDVCGKQKCPTCLRDEDSALSKPDTTDKYRQEPDETAARAECSGDKNTKLYTMYDLVKKTESQTDQQRTEMKVVLNKPTEGKKHSQNREIKLPTKDDQPVQIGAKFYDLFDEIADDKNEKYLIFKERHRASREDFRKLNKCHNPECKINKLSCHVHTYSSEESTRKAGEWKRNATKMQTGGTSGSYSHGNKVCQEAGTYNQTGQGITAPLCAVSQNQMTNSIQSCIANKTLEKGDANADPSIHSFKHTTCSHLQGCDGGGAHLQQSFGAERHSSFESLSSAGKSLSLKDESDLTKAGNQGIPAISGTCIENQPFIQFDYGRKTNNQSNTQIQVETKEADEGGKTATCPWFYK